MIVVHSNAAADALNPNISPTTLLNANYGAILRYTKDTSAAEFNRFIQGGIEFCLIQEGANQPAMRGFAGGVADARYANNIADSIGYEKLCAIYYVLEDPTRLPVSAWPTIVAYCQGVLSVGGRDAGGYGGRALVEHCRTLNLIKYGWQVSTWGSGVSPLCHLMQMANPTMNTLGGLVDQDAVLQPNWGQSPPYKASDVFVPWDNEQEDVIANNR